jgi:hypothetical protein
MNDKPPVVDFLLKEGVGVDRGVGNSGTEGEADGEEEDIKVSAGKMDDTGAGAEEVMTGVEKLDLGGKDGI